MISSIRSCWALLVAPAALLALPAFASATTIEPSRFDDSTADT